MNSSGDNFLENSEEDTLAELPKRKISQNNRKNNNFVDEHFKNLPETTSKNEDFSPLKWDEFFDRKEIVQIDVDDFFSVYFKGSNGPLFFLIHGGGYSALTWACFVEEIQAKVECQIVAPDLRGHGDTKVKNPQDLSVQRQIEDLYKIYTKLYGNLPTTNLPSLIIIGHRCVIAIPFKIYFQGTHYPNGIKISMWSNYMMLFERAQKVVNMGGALAVNLIDKYKIPNLLALAVIDVVEGSAMEALSYMRGYLKNRPQQFDTIETAIRWSLSSGTTINRRAARISMPSQLNEYPNTKPEGDRCRIYKWRVNLSKTQPFWNEWFLGLSKKFLDSKNVSAKLLILANIDRLDKTLLTGQMRGQFQTEVLAKVGHAVQEDSPRELAQIFATLIRRHNILIEKIKPKQ